MELLAPPDAEDTLRDPSTVNLDSNPASNEEERPLTYSEIMEQKISSMFQEVLQLHREGDPKAAVAKLNRAICLDPRNPELFRQRAVLHEALQDYHSVIINLKKVLSLCPSEHAELTLRLAAMFHLYGQTLMAEGKYEEALEMFQAAIGYQPGEKEYTLKSIACLLALQRYDECLVMIKRELESDDANPNLYSLRAQINLMFGNSTKAYYDACSALDLDPNHSEAVKLKKQLEDRAQACKNQAVQYSLVGKRAEAVKKITTAIEMDPAVAEYHVLRGALHRQRRDFTAAVDDFLKAMDKCGHQQDCQVYGNASRQLVLTYNDFAVECFRKRYFNEAVTLLNKAIKEEKREKGLYLNRGDCFYRLDSLPFALADYHQALELEPSDWSTCCRIAVVCCELGVACFGRGEHSEAERYFTSAIEHNPKVSRFYICRARTRHQLKDTDGTKEDIVAALVLDPGNEECLSLIARVFPGKTKEDLLQSGEAAAVAARLDVHIRSKSPRKRGGSKGGPPTPRYLAGIPKLKFALGGEVSEHTASTAGLDYARSQEEQAVKEGKENVEKAESTLDGRKAPNPHQWSVLEQPLPELAGQGGPTAIPLLRACLQETHFHSMLYYSKKNCTDEVEKVLRSPTEFGSPPPKIQTVSDVKFGSRTVITSNSLTRMSRTKE